MSTLVPLSSTILAGGFQLVMPWRVRLLGRVRILVLPVRSSTDHAAGGGWALVTLCHAGKSNVTPIVERRLSFYNKNGVLCLFHLFLNGTLWELRH